MGQFTISIGDLNEEAQMNEVDEYLDETPQHNLNVAKTESEVFLL